MFLPGETLLFFAVVPALAGSRAFLLFPLVPVFVLFLGEAPVGLVPRVPFFDDFGDGVLSRFSSARSVFVSAATLSLMKDMTDSFVRSVIVSIASAVCAVADSRR